MSARTDTPATSSPETAGGRGAARRRFLAATAGGAAGAVALLAANASRVLADHAEGGVGNFESASADPAIHARNTDVGAAIEAENNGGGPAIGVQGGVYINPNTPDGFCLSLKGEVSEPGSIASIERLGTGDGDALSIHNASSGNGRALSVDMDSTGGGSTTASFRGGDGLGHGLRAVRVGDGGGNGLIAAHRGSSTGAAIQAFAGMGESEPGELDYPAGTAIRGVGSVVGLRGEGPVGLSVAGRAAFSTVGSGTIASGASSATVANAAVQGTSLIAVTLNGNPGNNNGVAWVQRSAGTFTVRLMKNASAATPFTYLVAEPTS